MENNSKQKILYAAMMEFMDKGFEKASLRQIVKNAGLTTGAFYKYYPTKEALFAELVSPYANHMYSIYDNTLENFQKQSAEEQTENMMDASSEGVEQMVEYLYEHYDNFKLLLCCADGTEYADFIHNLVLREVKSTYQYIDTMRKAGVDIPDIDEELCHMIASGMFSGIFEIVIHDMEKEDAKKRVATLKRFYTGGWEKVFGIKF